MGKILKGKNLVVLGIVIVLAVILGLDVKNRNSNKNKSSTSSTAVSERANYLISTRQLKEWLKNKDFVLVNVHVPYEGEIEGTDYNIDYRDIDKFEQMFSKDQKIVIYCRSGAMSANAFKKLRERGFKNVYDVQGGMIAWEEMGEKLVFKK